MPVFMPGGDLVGYSAIKAHWLDIGAKEIYCTDTTDVFQEGAIFPGVKLYSAGKVVKDIQKMAIANSRLPAFVLGDINAEVAGVRAGARGSCGSSSATGSRRSSPASSGCTTTARPWCGATSSYSRRTLCRSRRDGRRRGHGRPHSVRGRPRDRRDDGSARLQRRTRRANRPCQLSDRVHRLGGTGDHDDARGWRRGAERGSLSSCRGDLAPRVDVPRAVTVAVLSLRLAGDAGDRGGPRRSPTRCRRQ